MLAMALHISYNGVTMALHMAFHLQNFSYLILTFFLSYFLLQILIYLIVYLPSLIVLLQSLEKILIFDLY